MIPKITVDHCDIATDTNKGNEGDARETILTELGHLIELASDPATINMSIGVAIQQLDNHLHYRNVNGEFNGVHSSADTFTMGWRHTVSPAVTETYQRLADQLIPEYVPDGRHSELNLGNAQLRFTSTDMVDDCMCDEDTVDDED